MLNFNPRSPRGLRRDTYYHEAFVLYISIHAAQEGCDSACLLRTHQVALFQSTQPKRAATSIAAIYLLQESDFNPRSPRGLRHKKRTSYPPALRFQSTQPKRAATMIAAPSLFQRIISIHAAQEGCDRQRECPVCG